MDIAGRFGTTSATDVTYQMCVMADMQIMLALFPNSSFELIVGFDEFSPTKSLTFSSGDTSGLPWICLMNALGHGLPLATTFSLEVPFISGKSELIIGRQPYLLGVKRVPVS